MTQPISTYTDGRSGEMDGLATNIGRGKSQLGPSAAISGFETNANSGVNAEEDESSLSSTGTDSLERNSSNASTKRGTWQVGADGTWCRYGSSESATSTGMSSICSSVAADDKFQDQVKQPTPSRKRMSNGSLKHATTILGTKPEALTTPPLAEVQTTNTAQLLQLAPAKRRGRPPKDKTVAVTPLPKVRRASDISKLQGVVRPRSSLPVHMPKEIFANQCIEAAHASRLNPYALHAGEHELLVNLLMNKEVTVYINIRNAILRLWHQNPLCNITVEEAAGCAKDGRFFGLAEVAYKWLVRHGHVNFGCIAVPRETLSKGLKSARQKTVVIIGAGVSGLTSGRQLEGLFAQCSESWTEAGERPPRVVLVEGRKRIGGRVYSKPLRSQVTGSLPNNLRNTAEMGAMIVTGFEHGNPLDTIIRGQLGLRYHLMTDELTIYDCDGKPIDEARDMLNTELYTDVSDRVGDFRAIPQHHQTLHGDEELINRARDPVDGKFEVFQPEPLFQPIDNSLNRKPATRRGRRRNAPPGTEKITGRSRVVEESGATQSAARAAKTMGWQLRDGVAKNQSISLHRLAGSTANPTLGAIMDEAIEQYQDLIKLTAQDMRLLNWHHANLEYANAAPVTSLSLSGHDQDTGNEFEGAHSEIIGGYTQLPRGLMNLPTKLDVRFGRIVESVHYNDGSDPDFGFTTKIVCTDGEVLEADEVVITAPLGVLKAGAIDFDPPLPSWKQGAIDRMGFGLLNKVVLLYDEPFWDDNRDMFGLLNEGESRNSLDCADYARDRGRFYLIWNASKTSGRPMLVALMAGHAAYEAEQTDTETLVQEINDRLQTTFGSRRVPAPLEVIVTRWKKDPFTRGTYSYVGPETQSGDYDLMARPVGNLHFAGEATCGTHPATVHGAFLSGLRVAAEVTEAMAGPITLPSPLVGASLIKREAPVPYLVPSALASMPSENNATPGGTWGSIGFAQQAEPAPASEVIVKQEPNDNITVSSVPPVRPSMPAKKASKPPQNSVCSADRSYWVQPESFDSADLNYEAAIIGAILGQLGERPVKPTRPGVNPFLLFTKDKWEECKTFCASGSPDAGAGRDAIRQTIGKWWKAATEEVKQPYILQSQNAQALADAIRKEWEQKVMRYDEDALRVRREYIDAHPPPIKVGMKGVVDAVGVSKRKTNTSNCVVLDHV